ncbi:MAG: hypothetical protein ACFFEW_15845, partial [Candidatus Thorarchaeota archaeon]
NRLLGVMETPEARLVYGLVWVGMYFWDQFAAVSLTNPEVATFEEHNITIVVDLPDHEGQTNSTGTGSANVLVAMNADAEAFEDLFIGYINGDLPTPLTGDVLLIYAAIGGIAVVVIGAVVCIRRR